MVHRGFSRGCYECRMRRKRCDGTEPACKSCISRGMMCSGYRHAGNFIFLERHRFGIDNVPRASNLSHSGDVEEDKPWAKSQLTSSTPDQNEDPAQAPHIESHQLIETLYSTNEEVGFTRGQIGVGATYHYKSREELCQTQILDHCAARILLATSNQIALYNAFAQVYMPKGHECMSLKRMIAFASSNELLHHALQMVCLLHVGSALGDERYCHAAQILHHRVILLLNRQLLEVSKSATLFMAVVQLLTMSNLFKAITSSNSQWQLHIHALGRMYKIWGEQWRTHGPVDAVKDFFNSPRVVFPLWLCLGNNDHIAGFDTAYCTISELPDASYLSSLHAHTFRSLRYIKQTADLVRELQRDCKKDWLHTEVLIITQQIMEREKDLHLWFAKWRVESLDAFAVLKDTVWVNSQFKSDPPPLYPQAWQFSSLESAYLYTLYWMLLLTLRTSLSALSNSIDTIADSLSDWRDYLPNDTYVIAKNLCMSLPYLMRPESGHLSFQLARMPIQLAYRWFKASGYMTEVWWCNKLVARSNWIGQHPPLLE